MARAALQAERQVTTQLREKLQQAEEERNQLKELSKNQTVPRSLKDRYLCDSESARISVSMNSENRKHLVADKCVADSVIGRF